MAYEGKAGDSGKNKQEELLSTARKRLEVAISVNGATREHQLQDLKFLAGSPDNDWQWPEDVVNVRNAKDTPGLGTRPCLTINKLPQHVNQVTNDQKQNRPSGKVIPKSEDADSDIAELLTGMIRHIEYDSDADVVYDTACHAQVTSGEGFFRILTDWVDEFSFEQEIKIGRIRNSFSVYLDPMIQDPCGKDADWGFITEDITKEEFETRWPDAKPCSSLELEGRGDEEFGTWIGEETVRIAEYFYAEYSTFTLCLFPGNQVCEKNSAMFLAFEAKGIKPLRTRQSIRRTIHWTKINGYDVLEEGEWPGKWIPIIRVVGNEYEVEGELHISGLVRNSKDAQRMYNYWTSQEAEMLALAPKAPFIAYGGQIEGYEYQWKTANTYPWPVLEVNPEVADGNGKPLPPPQRAMPPMQQSGLISAKLGASDDIKSTTGQYDSSLGMTSNERSGKAIMARERQADTGTYHYVDNLARAVRFGARQIIDLIPKIYDTKRIVRIMGEDGKPSEAQLDPRQQGPVQEIIDPQTQATIAKIYNPTIGKYDVAITTGPSYTTRRQEAADAMATLIQGNPELWSVAGDLLVKNLDWPGSDELADRLRRTIDPKLLQDGPPPALIEAEQQIQQMGQQMQAMMQMLQNVQTSFEQQELDIKNREASIKEYDAETKRASVVSSSLTEEQVQGIVINMLKEMRDTESLGSNPQELMNNNPPEE